MSAPRNSTRRTLLIALAAVVVLSVAAITGAWWWRHGSHRSDFASDADTGPAGIITVEPTCTTYQTHSTTDQLAELSRRTPHRVVREIYQQINAYRAASVATNGPAGDDDVVTADTLAEAMLNICGAIDSSAAAAAAAAVPPAVAPSAPAPSRDPGGTPVFMGTPAKICRALNRQAEAVDPRLADWSMQNFDTPVTQRSASDQQLWDAAVAVLADDAENSARLATASANPVVEDLLTLSTQYQRAFVHSAPTYTSADRPLYLVAKKSSVAVRTACAAAAR